jgi:hypothetical protein
VFGGYFYRLSVGLFAQWHLCRFVFRVGDTMRNTDREAFRTKYGGRAEAWARTRPQLLQMAKLFVPKVLATYLPWYTPHDIEMSDAAKALANHYTALSAEAAGARGKA